MKEPNKLLKKLHGYHAIPRNIIFLLKKKVLTKEEYILYCSSLSFADWDNEKPTTYGSSNLTQDEIEYLLGFSKGYVSKFSKGLFQKGFWHKRSDKRIQIIGYELIEQSILQKILQTDKIIDVCKFIADKQTQIANQQQQIAQQQQNFPKEKRLSLLQKVVDQQPSPSKSNVSSYKNSCNSLKSEEEYEKIKEEMRFSSLAIEDMKWIDLNVHEDPAVPS